MSTLIVTSVTNAGNPQVILGYSFASVNRKTDRIPVRFNLPREVTDVDTGTTSVADTARFVGEFIIPDTWTETERGHFHAYVDNLIGNAIVKGYVKSRDPFYG
jgi:protoporphyrinogen oxidase